LLGHIHRALDVGEQDGDLLALAFKRGARVKDLVSEMLGGIRTSRGSGGRSGTTKRGTTISAKLLLGRIVRVALRAPICQRNATVPAEPLARWIFRSTLRAAHIISAFWTLSSSSVAFAYFRSPVSMHRPQRFIPTGFSNSHFVQRIDPCNLAKQRILYH
jgi:hypothetical protein